MVELYISYSRHSRAQAQSMARNFSSNIYTSILKNFGRCERGTKRNTNFILDLWLHSAEDNTFGKKFFI